MAGLGFFAGLGVIAGLVQKGAVERDADGKGPQIVGIKVDHIGQHGIAPLFAVKGQHLADAARLAERVEQVFGVKAVIHPDARCRRDDAVDGIGHRQARSAIKRDAMYPAFDIGGQGKGIGHQGQHRFEPALDVVAHGGGQLYIILDKDHRHRTLGQSGAAGLDEMIE